MTVLQLGPYPPPHGGVQTNIVAIRNHLRRHGISAPVINLTRHRRQDVDEVYYPSTARQVVRLLFTLPSDIIHLHIGGRLSRRLLGLCWVASLVPGRRVVLTFHSGGYPHSEEGRNATRRSLPAYVLRRLDGIIAVNAEIALLFEQLGVDPARIKVISPYAPITIDERAPLPEPLRRFCESHHPLLTTIGLLEPEYDLPLQIEALGMLRHRLSDAGLVIVGSGSLEQDLRRLIAGTPHRDHILLCGDLAHDTAMRTLARSDVFLRTTHYDGDSVSVREALQLGVPVVATDNGMRPPNVRLIRPFDKLALCEAVADALRSTTPDPVPDAPDRQLDEVLDFYSGLLGVNVRHQQSSTRFCNEAGKS